MIFDARLYKRESDTDTRELHNEDLAGQQAEALCLPVVWGTAWMWNEISYFNLSVDVWILPMQR